MSDVETHVRKARTAAFELARRWRVGLSTDEAARLVDATFSAANESARALHHMATGPSGGVDHPDPGILMASTAYYLEHVRGSMAARVQYGPYILGLWEEVNVWGEDTRNIIARAGDALAAFQTLEGWTRMLWLEETLGGRPVRER